MPIRKPGFVEGNKCQNWPKVDELRAKFEMKKMKEKPDEKPKIFDEKVELKVDEKLPDEYDPLYDNEVLFKGNYAKYRNLYDMKLKYILNHDVSPTINRLDENVMKKESLMKNVKNDENIGHKEQISLEKNPSILTVSTDNNIEEVQSFSTSSIVRLPNPVKMPKIGDGFGSLVPKNRVRRKVVKKKDISSGLVTPIRKFFEKKVALQDSNEKRKHSPENIEEKKKFRLDDTTKEGAAD